MQPTGDETRPVDGSGPPQRGPTLGFRPQGFLLTPPALSRSADMELPLRLGDFLLLRVLGRGGMGVVYLAEQESLRRRVALKLIKPEHLLFPGSRARFLREARAASRLDHPGICPVYEVGEVEGIPYLAMRFLEGETLGQRLARLLGPPPLPPDRAQALELAKIGELAARALHAAHEAGLIHRDIKPANLMVAAGGQPILLDFGLAREERVDPAQPSLSMEILGTPTYMAPELLGEPPARPDRRSDLYALGVTLFEALALQAPFQAPSWQGLYEKIRTGDIPDPCRLNRAIPRDLGVVLRTAMDRDPARRYRTALDLAEDLRRVQAGEPVAARPAGPLLRLSRWGRRNPGLATAIAALFLVLAAGFAGSQALLGQVRRSLARTRAQGLANASAVAEEEDPALALLLAEEAYRAAPPTPGTSSRLCAAASEARLRQVVFLPEKIQGGLAFTPDSTRFVFALPGEGRIYDLQGRMVHSTHPDKQIRPPSAKSFLKPSPDGASLLLLEEGKRLHLLDREGRFQGELAQGQGQILVANFTDGGRQIVALDERGEVTLWDRQGRRLRSFAVAGGKVAGFDLDPGRGQLAVLEASPGRPGARLRVWNLSGETVHQITGLEESPEKVLLDPQGGWIALAARGWAVLHSRTGLPPIPLGAPNTSKPVMAFSDDGMHFCLARQDGRICRVNLVRAKADGPTTPRAPLEWQADTIQIEALHFTPGGGLLIAVNRNGIVTLWRLAIEARPVFALRGRQGPLEALAVSPDGRWLLAAGSDRTARLWELQPPGLLAVPIHHQSYHGACFLGEGQAILAIAPDFGIALWSQDGRSRQLLPPTYPGTLSLWPALPGEGFLMTRWLQIHSGGRHAFEHRDPAGACRQTFQGHDSFVREIQQQGSVLLSLSTDGTCRFWDRSGRTLGSVGNVSPVSPYRLHPHGDRALVVSNKGPEGGRDRCRACLVDTQGRILSVLAHTEEIETLAFSPAGDMILSGDRGGLVRLWTGEGLPRLEIQASGRGQEILAADFLNQGARFFTAAKDGKVRLWSAAGTPIRVLVECQPTEIQCVEVSPREDAFLIAAVNQVRVYSLPAGKELFSLPLAGEKLRPGLPRFARFSPTGDQILTFHSQGVVRTWPACPEGIVALARRHLSRGFTPAERSRYRELLAER